jgi:predicted phosphodiesterase
MKIQLASDLHLEFLQKWPGERLIAPVHGVDVLVLAGDIANGVQVCKLFSDWPVPVLYVAGNHEMYDHPIIGMREKLRRECKEVGIVFMDNDTVTIGGVRFLGATLWTDYRLPRLNRTQSQLMEVAGSRLNDHFLIRSGRHTFTPADALRTHEKSRTWLEAQLDKPFNGKTVVITHHGCHPLSVHPRYIVEQLNAAFVSDLSDLMPQVDLWMHGHVHDSFDYTVGRCRVRCNPAGYVRNRGWAKGPEEFMFENEAFNAQLVIEV